MKNFLKKHPNVPLLFFLSGISGLVYETVWFRMLIRVFGTTLEATSTVLAVFMGGLALGAVLAGKKADKLANPLKVYAVLEVLVALTALARLSPDADLAGLDTVLNLFSLEPSARPSAMTAWDEAYRDAGLQVIGIHAPEYAFEKEQRNVEQGIANFGIDYPVAMDNNLSTWTNYRNRYWPATYLIDADGVVRHIKFGEGGYDDTERLIRELLLDADPGTQLPGETAVADETPDAGATTPETYLSAGKEVNFGGDEEYTTGANSYEYPRDLARDTFALDGDWTIDFQGATPAGADARVKLAYTATQEVRVVLGGSGTVVATVDGKKVEIEVDGSPDSYRLLTTSGSRTGEIELAVPTGVTVYSFTFG